MPKTIGWTTWNWAWKTAWRDARGSRGKAVLYGLSMALGIAALVAMGSFGTDLDRAVDEQTQNLVGADLIVTAREPFSEEAAAFLDGLPGESAAMVRFASMVLFPKNGETALSRVRGVAGNFPFYGTLETHPAEAAAQFRNGPYALVEQSLMTRAGAQIGDVIRLGKRDFTIAGELKGVPGEAPIAALMGPRIFIALDQVAETDLIQEGSLVFYSRAFKLPTGTDADALVEAQQGLFKRERLNWDTVPKRRRQLGEAMAGLSGFLNLVACLALLLGGLGVAAAVHYHMRQKTKQIAVMRCLGAGLKQVLLVYLIQVLAMGLLAIVLGTAAGVALQFQLPALVSEFLPFRFEPRIQAGAVAVAAGWGLLMSLLPAMAPLAEIRKISPLLSFRPDLAPRQRDWLAPVVYAAGALAWWLFAVARTGSLLQGSLFMGFLLAGIGLLFLTAKGLGLAARRFLSPRLPFAWRFGLANLFRPQNQTSVFLIILGMGIFLITVLAGSRSMLLRQFQRALDGDKPNFIAFDIQTHQKDGVVQLVEDQGFRPSPPIAIVPMRLESIKGEPIGKLLDGEIPEWMLRREYRSTYRADLNETETLLRGRLPARVDTNASPIPVTVEEDLAQALGLDLADGFTVDVMGITLELEVAGIRRVQWESMQPNFYLVFPEGVLEAAPQMFLLTTRVASPEGVAGLQRQLVERYPNVSSVDLSQVVRSVEAIMTKAAAVVQFLAALCMVTGFILLGSAVWNSRYQRLGEHALLRTLGASRRQLGQMTMTEYFLLGVFAALTGLVLAVAANWALATFLFKIPANPGVMALLAPILLLPLLTLVLGYLGLRGSWRVSPRATLREEGF